MFYRLYSPDDFAALYAIEEACFEPALRFGRGYMRQLVNSSATATWIADDEGRLAGFAIVEWTEEECSASGYIQTIEVAPAWRGRGVGGGLLDCLEGSARAANATSILLHVNARNTPAYRLYEARGYVCVGREENYYGRGEGALIYRKLLVHDAEWAR